MFRAFRDLSIALKLNLVQGILLLGVLSVAAFVTSAGLRQQLETQNLADLQQTNKLVVQMFEAYDESLRQSAERLGNVFEGLFATPVTVDAGGAEPVITFAGVPANGRSDVVDAFTAKSGAVATVFARKGDDFFRVATSLKKEDGSRAVGTFLGDKHPARTALLEGRAYGGKARLFGRDYMTQYLPVKDASGKVVGVLFVGIDFTSGLAALKQKVLSIKIGDTGYVYALDAGAARGELTVHPAREGANLLAAKDAGGREFIREMLDKRAGFIRYDWQNPNERAAREKVVAYTHFPAWNWVIASGSYLEEFNREADKVLWQIIAMALLIVPAVGLGCVFCTRRWVAKPLREMIEHAERIATGDLAREMPVLGRDEVGRMSAALNRMAGSLKTMLGEVREASSALAQDATALVGSAEHVAENSQAQSDAASGMAAAVEQMSVSIDQVAQHAQEANGLSVASGRTAEEGARVIGDAVGEMDRIAASVREAAATVTALGARSQDISSVVRVIREIAEQTNLLALNAAIEAARAGEQGRGFAVVADEVRKLAERTAGSTQEIADIIGRMQAGAVDAVRRMESGVGEVEAGVALADRAGHAIGEIGGQTRGVIDAVGNISTAIAEQNAASLSIASGVEQIAQMAEANNGSARDTARAAQQLRDLSHRLEQSLSGFRVA